MYIYIYIYTFAIHYVCYDIYTSHSIHSIYHSNIVDSPSNVIIRSNTTNNSNTSNTITNRNNHINYSSTKQSRRWSTGAHAVFDGRRRRSDSQPLPTS